MSEAKRRSSKNKAVSSRASNISNISNISNVPNEEKHIHDKPNDEECQYTNADLMEMLQNMAKDIGILQAQRDRDCANFDRLFERMYRMEKLLQEKDKKIEELETRIDNFEQYTRKEDIIITGLKIKKTYADKTKERNAEEIDTKRVNETEVQTLAFLNSENIEMNVKEEEIAACHTLGPVLPDGTQKVIVRFVNRKSKVKVLLRAKDVRGVLREKKVFINEHLTKKNGAIAKRARELRKGGKIANTFVRDCKIFVKDLSGETFIVNSLSDLNDF
jgi:galactitol-specific phosphotransferase system IIB component